jgi:hypothetical protein
LYIAFLFFGIGTLLPFNAVLTSLDFFVLKMPGYQPGFVFPFAVNVLSLAVQITVFLYLHKLSYSLRFLTFFLGSSVIMIALPIMADNLDP